jgi:hypothetical protein
MATMPHLPATLTADELHTIEVDYQPAYIDDNDDGNLRLSKRVANLICEKLTEIEQLVKERDEGIATRDAQLAKSQAARTNETIATALKSALLTAGATEKLIPGAVALLRQQHTFEVETGYADEKIVTAQTDAGLHSLPMLVENFLESDEGAGFRPKRPAPNDGYFTSLMESLRQPR